MYFNCNYWVATWCQWLKVLCASSARWIQVYHLCCCCTCKLAYVCLFWKQWNILESDINFANYNYWSLDFFFPVVTHISTVCSTLRAWGILSGHEMKCAATEGRLSISGPSIGFFSNYRVEYGIRSWGIFIIYLYLLARYFIDMEFL